MRFEEWVQPYYQMRRPRGGEARGAEAGFAAFREACALFGNPQEAFEAVHIGGTNGKGSVAFGVFDQLKKQGVRAGLFTSPHLISCTERIRVDDQLIRESDIVRLGPEIVKRCELAGIKLHFFDWITLLSFLYFCEQKIELAVVEVGVGGRWDPTRLVNAKVAAITSISLDHQDVLGETLVEIAENKAAILKVDRPAVLGPSAASLIDFPGAICVEKKKSIFEENDQVARAIIGELGLSVIEPIKRPPCRFERVGDIALDVAHNPAGFLALSQALEGSCWQVLVALCKDKDLVGCLEPLKERATCFHFVSFGGARAASVSALASVVGDAKARCYESVEAGIEGWLASGGERLACGSFYLIGQVAAFLDQQGLWPRGAIPEPV